MPLTQAQRNAVERLAEHSDHGAYVRNNPDDTIEVLKVERGALYRYIVSQTGGSTLIESRPRNWRYSWSGCLSLGGPLFFVLMFVLLLLLQEEVVSYPLVNEGKVQTVAALLGVSGIVAGFVGAELSPHPQDFAGADKWAHIGYIVD